jgi:uncharacterized membrane protein YeaQ/YmgE (transglycosylase-associated protein family)
LSTVFPLHRDQKPRTRRRFTVGFQGISVGTNEEEVMGIIAWILLGLFAGIIAKALLPGDDPGGIIITTIVGVVGALLGGFLAKAFGLGDPIDEFFDISTWIAAIVGAIILLFAYRAIAGRRGVLSRG